MNEVMDFLSNTVNLAGVVKVVVGIIATYVFDNLIKTKKDRALAFQVLVRGEELLPEGTKADSALDIFIQQYKERHGKTPTAGALKTFSDVRHNLKKDNPSITFETKPSDTKNKNQKQNTG